MMFKAKVPTATQVELALACSDNNRNDDYIASVTDLTHEQIKTIRMVYEALKPRLAERITSNDSRFQQIEQELRDSRSERSDLRTEVQVLKGEVAGFNAWMTDSVERIRKLEGRDV